MIAFGAGVYVARTLGAPMYGVIGFATAVVLYFTQLGGCGIDLPGVRDVARDRGWLDSLGSDLLTARTLIAAGLAAILAAAALLVLPSPEGPVLALYALTVLPVGPNPRWILLGLSRPRPVAVARTLGEALFLALVLLAVRSPEHIERVPLAQFLGDALATAIALAWLRRSGTRLVPRLDWARVRPVLRAAFPLVVNVVVGLMIFNSDLIFLWLFRDRATVGRYSASYQLISFLINMTSAYALSLLPALSAAAREAGGGRALYATSQAQVFAVGLPVAVGGVLVAAPMIALVYGGEYAPSALPLAILLASVPFLLYRDVGSMALVVSGRERVVMRITTLALLANVALNLVVIPRYGMAGAASTTLATEVARAALTGWAVRGEAWPALQPRRMWRPALAAALMAAALLGLGPMPLAAAVGLGAAIYAAVLTLTGALVWRRGGPPTLRV